MQIIFYLYVLSFISLDQKDKWRWRMERKMKEQRGATKWELVGCKGKVKGIYVMPEMSSLYVLSAYRMALLSLTTKSSREREQMKIKFRLHHMILPWLALKGLWQIQWVHGDPTVAYIQLLGRGPPTSTYMDIRPNLIQDGLAWTLMISQRGKSVETATDKSSGPLSQSKSL